MKKIFLALLIVIGLNLFCNQPPEVSDVIVQQRDDGSYIVDIYYDLVDTDGDLMLVSISASDDHSGNWDYAITSVTGNIGLDQTSGSSKHIVWDFAADHPQVLNIPTTIKVTADDRNGDTSGDIEWNWIAAGEYESGMYNEILSIDYNYEMMKYEVTNAQFMEYLEAASVWVQTYGDQHAVFGAYGGDQNFPQGTYPYYILGTPFEDNYGQISYVNFDYVLNVPPGYSAGDFDDHPAVGVTWFGAKAYAEHYGWRLPSSAEWEKAAAGMAGWEYCWYGGYDGAYANFGYSGDPWSEGTTPVGFYNGQIYSGFQTTDSPSPYGCYDMGGNANEWTTTGEYDSGEYRMIVRGGSYQGSQPWYFRPYNYNLGVPELSGEMFAQWIGFRCVRDESVRH